MSGPPPDGGFYIRLPPPHMRPPLMQTPGSDLGGPGGTSFPFDITAPTEKGNDTPRSLPDAAGSTTQMNSDLFFSPHVVPTPFPVSPNDRSERDGSDRGPSERNDHNGDASYDDGHPPLAPRPEVATIPPPALRPLALDAELDPPRAPSAFHDPALPMSPALQRGNAITEVPEETLSAAGPASPPTNSVEETEPIAVMLSPLGDYSQAPLLPSVTGGSLGSNSTVVDPGLLAYDTRPRTPSDTRPRGVSLLLASNGLRPHSHSGHDVEHRRSASDPQLPRQYSTLGLAASSGSPLSEQPPTGGARRQDSGSGGSPGDDPMALPPPPPGLGDDVGLSVPWHLRHPGRRSRTDISYLSFLSSPVFWRKVEFAFRVAAIAGAPAAALALSDHGETVLFSQTYVTAIAFFIAQPFMGASLAAVRDTFFAFLLVLPLCAGLAEALQSAHWAVWAAVQTVLLFAVGVASEGVTRKLSLMFVVMAFSVMAPVKSDATATEESWRYSAHIARDTAIAVGFGLAAALLPFPRLACTAAEETLRDALMTCGVCLVGIGSAFWVETNLERSVALMRVRNSRAWLDELLEALRGHLATAESEPFTSARRRRLAALQVMLQRLANAVDALIFAVRRLRDAPAIVDESPQQQRAYSVSMPGPVAELTAAVDALLMALGDSDSDTAVADYRAAVVRRAALQLEKKFAAARKAALSIHFDENPSPASSPTFAPDSSIGSRRSLSFPTPRRGVPEAEEADTVMALFLLHITHSAATVASVDTAFGATDRGCGETMLRWVRTTATMVVAPGLQQLRFLWRLLRERRAADVQRVKESAKVTVAIMLTFGATFLFDRDVSSVGPEMVAFMSATNTGEALQGASQRLMGVMLGPVLAILAGSISTEYAFLVPTISGMLFLFAFVSTSPAHVLAAQNAGFSFVALMAPGALSPENAMTRTRDNVIAGILYFLCGNIVWQQSPSALLRVQREATLQALSGSIRGLLDVFGRASPTVSAPSTPEPLSRRASFVAVAMSPPPPLSLDADGAKLGAVPPETPAAIDYGAMEGEAILELRIEPAPRLTARVISRSATASIAAARASFLQERALLPLAVVEPSMRAKQFPVRAAEAFLQGQRQLLATIDTLLVVWDVLFAAGDAEAHTAAECIVAPMAGTAREAAAEVADAFNLMRVMLTDPSAAGLSAALADRCLQVRDTVAALQSQVAAAFASFQRRPAAGASPTSTALTPALREPYGTWADLAVRLHTTKELTVRHALAFNSLPLLLTLVADDMWRLALLVDDLQCETNF